VTLDHEDIAAIADAVETGVTRSRNKFLEEVTHSVMLVSGMTAVALALFALFKWGGTVLGYVMAFIAVLGKH
jgi:cystathionine beta-lyase/cystathionine gamma-synthase